MRFDTQQQQVYCGIDVHARTMYVCILKPDGEMLVHRAMQASPDTCLQAIAPDRDGLVVAVEGLLTWYGRADLCAQDGLPVVLGHALDRKAIHGGQAQNDRIDAHQMAVLLRGGMLPQASGYPAKMRAPRELRRRRLDLLRTRAALLPHLQNPNRQAHLPAIGTQLASKAHRDGVAERFPAPAGHKRLDVALARIGHSDHLRRNLAWSSLTTAKPHHPNTLDVLRTVPGIGDLLSLVRR
jgi:hypothetical protein